MTNNVYPLPEMPYLSIFRPRQIESACVPVILSARNDSLTRRRQTGNNQNKPTGKKRDAGGEFQKQYGIHRGRRTTAIDVGGEPSGPSIEGPFCRTDHLCRTL